MWCGGGGGGSLVIDMAGWLWCGGRRGGHQRGLVVVVAWWSTDVAWRRQHGVAINDAARSWSTWRPHCGMAVDDVVWSTWVVMVVVVMVLWCCGRGVLFVHLVGLPI